MSICGGFVSLCSHCVSLVVLGVFEFVLYLFVVILSPFGSFDLFVVILPLRLFYSCDSFVSLCSCFVSLCGNFACL